jgi:DNA polymerase III subunit beta
LTLDLVEASGLPAVENDMRGIGEMARQSGLSVSALRFYDGAGVLVPAAVDPVTGYRRYADDQVRAARLIAGLRRVGMPLAEITRAVQDRKDPHSVRRLCDKHLRRLEDGLADARREFSRIHALLDHWETFMTRVTLPAAALAATIDAVRFAATADPELPMLGSVLIEIEDSALTLVTTDRYRLAVARAAVDVEGPPVRVVVPLGLVDGARPLLFGDGPVSLLLDAARVEFQIGERRLAEVPLDVDYPDFRRLLGADFLAADRAVGGGARRVVVDVPALRTAIAAEPSVWREHGGAPYEILVLGVDADGGLRLAAEGEWAADEQAHVAVNREFLLQALDAGGAGQLVLELDGPIKPLAVRVPEDTHRFSILMPVRH